MREPEKSLKPANLSEAGDENTPQLPGIANSPRALRPAFALRSSQAPSPTLDSPADRQAQPSDPQVLAGLEKG